MGKERKRRKEKIILKEDQNEKENEEQGKKRKRKESKGKEIDLKKDNNKKRKLRIYGQINKELQPDDGFQRVQLNMVKSCSPPFYAGMRRQMLSDENFFGKGLDEA